MSLRAEPYETRVVLPHERTHAGPKEGRLRLLRAARAQLEPIFLLLRRRPPLSPPDAPARPRCGGHAALAGRGDAGVTDFFADRQLLIADGHHRYETALAYAAEAGRRRARGSMVVLVSTSDPGSGDLSDAPRVRGRPDIAAER